MQFRVHTFQIRKGNLLLQDHLVERSDEVRIKEPTVEDTKTKTSADKLEVVQVLWVDA